MYKNSRNEKRCSWNTKEKDAQKKKEEDWATWEACRSNRGSATEEEKKEKKEDWAARGDKRTWSAAAEETQRAKYMHERTKFLARKFVSLEH